METIHGENKQQDKVKAYHANNYMECIYIYNYIKHFLRETPDNFINKDGICKLQMACNNTVFSKENSNTSYYNPFMYRGSNVSDWDVALTKLRNINLDSHLSIFPKTVLFSNNFQDVFSNKLGIEYFIYFRETDEGFLVVFLAKIGKTNPLSDIAPFVHLSEDPLLEDITDDLSYCRLAELLNFFDDYFKIDNACNISRKPCSSRYIVNELKNISTTVKKVINKLYSSKSSQLYDELLFDKHYDVNCDVSTPPYNIVRSATLKDYSYYVRVSSPIDDLIKNYVLDPSISDYTKTELEYLHKILNL
jgi:hypothetical protein